MRTTLDLPEPLVQEAMKVSGEKSKTATIVAALQHLVRKHRLQKIKDYRGKVDIDIDLNATRKRA